jgi:hypothetical protein
LILWNAVHYQIFAREDTLQETFTDLATENRCRAALTVGLIRARAGQLVVDESKRLPSLFSFSSPAADHRWAKQAIARGYFRIMRDGNGKLHPSLHKPAKVAEPSGLGPALIAAKRGGPLHTFE